MLVIKRTAERGDTRWWCFDTRAQGNGGGGGAGGVVILHSVTKRDATTAVHEMEIQFTFYELHRFGTRLGYVLTFSYGQ